MGTHSDLRHNSSVIRYDSAILNPFEPRLFDAAWLNAEDHHRGGSAGRGEATFLSFAGHEMVLRRFRRGGLVGRFNRDLYLGTRPERSRAFQEFELLSWMRGRGLAVPRPVAAQMTPAWPFYRAAIITERVPNACPMEELLRDGPLASDIWCRAGEVVRQMHDLGVYHSDLNCRNILIEDGARVWLIDFDKCRRRTPGPWGQENLDRLHRSLRKEDGKGKGLHWADDDWTALVSGYDAAKSDGTQTAR